MPDDLDEELYDVFDDLFHDVMDAKDLSVDEAYAYINRHLLIVFNAFKG